jgi:hypothetical protein
VNISREADAADRLALALASFRRVQNLIVAAHRKLRGLPEDADRFWASNSERLEQHQRACATEVMAAYRSFSGEGGTANGRDRRLVGEAHHLLVGDAGDSEAKPRVSLALRDTELEISRRLRLVIKAELERREISDPSEIAAVLGIPRRQADRLVCRTAWKEGDLALLRAAAARLGLPV